MWDFIIQRELSKTVVAINQKKIPTKTARTKLDDLVKLTKANVQKGRKRELKNNIFRVKKQFKL
jgi:hypothetical protein